MEFQRERVYTALNADELRAGDKVIVAYNLYGLKEQVKMFTESAIDVIEVIQDEDYFNRFKVKHGESFPLAYLVERKENCLKCKKCEVISDKSMHCDWVGTGPITSAQIEKCNHYEPKTGQKEMCLNCKHYNKANDFRDCRLVNNPTGACPHYEAEPHYRPFKDTDELIEKWWKLDGWSKVEAKYKKDKLRMPLIWLKNKYNLCHISSLVTGFFDSKVIISGEKIESMEMLYADWVFPDGSPCGVEE